MESNIDKVNISESRGHLDDGCVSQQTVIVRDVPWQASGEIPTKYRPGVGHSDNISS